MAIVGKKAANASNSKIVLWLVGATVCYQVIYQSLMLHMLRSDEDSCEGGASVSDRCLELQLFHSWRAAEIAEKAAYESDLYIEHLAQIPNTTSHSQSSAVHGQVDAAVEAVTTTVIDASQTTSPQQGTIVLGAGAGLGKNGWSPITEWGRGLQAIQGRFEARMARLPSVRRAQARERQEHFDQMYNETLAAIHNRSANSAWVREVTAMQEQLQARAEKLARAHRQASGNVVSNSSSKNGSSLLQEILAFGRELCEAPHRRGRASCEMFLGITNRTAPQTHASASDTTQHSKVTKEQFEAETAKFNQRMSQLQEASKAWDKQFATNVAAYMREMCADLGRRNDKACAQYRPNSTVEHPTVSADATTKNPSVSLRGAVNTYLQRLSWSSVSAWKGRKATKGRVSANLDDLHYLKWQGKVPKAACITLVPSGRGTIHRMKYFINNFRLQSYEGPRELILVYRHTDEEVASLVQAYADGVYIKAVASRDTQFPSTTAFRYAAWTSDADVIARWEFEEWHHPDRLAMQVRALALSSRPASVLSHWTFLGTTHASDKIRSADPGYEGSIVGEARWMQEHWMPLLESERIMLAGVQSPWVVEVNMPELLSVYEAPSHGQDVAHPSEGQVSNSTETKIATSAESNMAAVCRAHGVTDVTFSNATVSGLEDKIQGKFGDGMKTVYKVLLERNEEVQQNMRTLCKEAAAEGDLVRQRGLLDHAADIATAQRELKDHFVAVDALFDLA